MDSSCLKLFERSQPDLPNLLSKVNKPNPLPQIHEESVALGRFPQWLHRKMPSGQQLFDTSKAVHEQQLHTVCEQANCPNLSECYSKKTATFLAMGKQCTRQCGFCSIEHASLPAALDENEPKKISQAVKNLGLKHVVITQVARDDLGDGGALHMSRIITYLREQNPTVTIEVLTSDYEGRIDSLKMVMDQQPEVFNHNLETVQRLSPRIRHRASYERSLHVLAKAKDLAHGKTQFIKSGLMVGLGETDEEILTTLQHLKEVGVNIVTIGQYLQSTREGFLVKRFVHPEIFERYRLWGQNLGIAHMYCAPFVRSSYNASLFIENKT
jgi:lipoic acid synthetase